MSHFRKKWFIIILIIFLTPLFLDLQGHYQEFKWLLYIVPSVLLPFYFGIKGGLIASFVGMLLYIINELIDTFYKLEPFQFNDIWGIIMIALVNITVAITIGKLIDILQSEQSSLKKAITKMEFMAYHDYLTGLPNRWNYEIKLKEALEQEENKKSAVMFLDLDRFKFINDSLGHTVGDRLLKEVSKRIEQTLTENECLARQGGDEFIFFMTHCQSNKQIEERVLSLHQLIQEPFRIQNQEYFISSSIGVSLYPEDGVHLEALIQQADIAMYAAKEKGGNGYEFYNCDKQQEIHDMMKIETHLRKALQQNEFTIAYQPFMNLHNGRIIGVEALIRWYSKELGVVSPAEFIPIAEDIGIISQLGEWVLREACGKVKNLSKINKEPIRIAVNISSIQFKDKKFVDIVKQVLEETQLPGSQLELEITESVSLDDIDKVMEKLSALKKMGIGISIDDFGTGYSSISYLKYLPVDTLKIDRSFIQNMLSNMKDRALVESVISLSKNFGFNVIAEGVETAEQLNLLKSLNCSQAQGYLFSKPVQLKGLYRFIEQNNKQNEMIEHVS